MLTTLAGLFVILHGLVHFWLVSLSLRLFEFKPEMGWTGESWLLSRVLNENAVRRVASAVFSLIALLFVVSGVGVILQAGWSQMMLLTSAMFSSFFILIYFDGNPRMIVQKGLIALIINAAVIVLVLRIK